MPYQTNQDLSESVRNHLPPAAQDIYRAAFNHTHSEYQDPKKRHHPNDSLEEICHRVAWAAVKKKYTKGADGHWHESSSSEK